MLYDNEEKTQSAGTSPKLPAPAASTTPSAGSPTKQPAWMQSMGNAPPAAVQAPATPADQREFVNTAIEFLHSGAEYYRAGAVVDESRLHRQLIGWKETLLGSLSIIRSALNNDAALEQKLRQAYQDAVQVLITAAASQLGRAPMDIFESCKEYIHEWAWMFAQPVPSQSTAQTEWNTHPHIQSRYSTLQAYESVRNQVAGWRDPLVADPASYIDAAIVEWNANPGMHPDFSNNFDGDPHRSYLNLKRLYQNRGINDPANYLATNIVAIPFYNRRTPGHTDLRVALNNAQTAMTAAGHTFVLGAGTWSYVPRTFNDNINRLSNHALGKAIDINPGNNPHITSTEDFLVINALCSPVLPHGLLAETDYANLKSASDFFQQHFNNTWVSDQEHRLTQMQGQHPPPPDLQAQQRLVNAIHHRRAMLNGYAARGFLNLPAELVAGLQSAGLSWGGEWHTAKDFMHFELPNP